MKAMMKVHQSAATTEQKVKEEKFWEKEFNLESWSNWPEGDHGCLPSSSPVVASSWSSSWDLPSPSRPQHSGLSYREFFFHVLPPWKTWPEWKNLLNVVKCIFSYFFITDLSNIKCISVKYYMSYEFYDIWFLASLWSDAFGVTAV